MMAVLLAGTLQLLQGTTLGLLMYATIDNMNSILCTGQHMAVQNGLA
jgi:hypothetical protein